MKLPSLRIRRPRPPKALCSHDYCGQPVHDGPHIDSLGQEWTDPWEGTFVPSRRYHGHFRNVNGLSSGVVLSEGETCPECGKVA